MLLLCLLKPYQNRSKNFLRLWTIKDELEASCGVSKETLEKKKRGTLKGHKKKKKNNLNELAMANATTT